MYSTTTGTLTLARLELSVFVTIYDLRSLAYSNLVPLAFERG
jgi:hypothetical protein